MKTSYKEMLRNRIPTTVDYALKWCKCKQLWIDHVYNSFIKVYASREDRYITTRTILGISSKYRNFNFHATIDWDNLTPEETTAWKNVQTWVEWFQVHYKFVENALDVENSTDLMTQKRVLNKQFPTLHLTPGLCEYLIQCKYGIL